MTFFPVFLDLAGERVLVVGGGAVGLRRALGLVEAGADVTVVSPGFAPGFEDLAVRRVERGFHPADLAGVRLVFACADLDEVNDLVAREARARGVWCAHASHPEHGDLRLGAVARRGPLQVSVSTGADLPYLSQALRDRLEAMLPADLPVESWAARRAAALELDEVARDLVLSTLKAEIRRAVEP